MGWVLGLFSLEMMVLTVLGLLGIAALVLIRRIWRSGLGSYTESHLKMEQRIRDTDAEIRERNMAMPVGEQLHILEAALHELLDLEGNPTGWAVHRREKSLCVETPQGELDIAYAVRQTVLRGDGRVMRGAAHWEVAHAGHMQSFAELGHLVRWLRAVMAGNAPLQENVEELTPISLLRQRSAARARRRHPRTRPSRSSE